MKKQLPASTLSASTLSTLVMTSAASGAIIANNSSFSTDAHTASTLWDIDGDNVSDANFAGSYAPQFSQYMTIGPYGPIFTTVQTDTRFTVALSQQANSFRVGATNYGIYWLTDGSTVDSSLPFATAKTIISNESYVFTQSSTYEAPGYIGFSFQQEGETRYGWAEVTLNMSAYEVTIVQWAYDNSGAPIQAGAVPEPAETAAGLGALALGAAGLRRWRKQHKAT